MELIYLNVETDSSDSASVYQKWLIHNILNHCGVYQGLIKNTSKMRASGIYFTLGPTVSSLQPSTYRFFPPFHCLPRQHKG